MNLFKTSSCLRDKSPRQVAEYFILLYNFSKTDLLFFCEQYDDLNKKDKQTFLRWLVNYKPKTQ